MGSFYADFGDLSNKMCGNCRNPGVGEHEQNDDDEGRKVIRRLELFEVEKIDADHDDESAAEAGELGDHPLADPGLDDRGNKRQKALVQEDGNGRKSRSDAHCGRENDRHEAVKHRLGVQDGVIPFRAGLERSDDSHCADAEQHRGVEKRVGKAGIAGLARQVTRLTSRSVFFPESVLEEAAERKDFSVDIPPCTQKAADDERQGEIDDVLRLESHAKADDERHDARGGRNDDGDIFGNFP